MAFLFKDEFWQHEATAPLLLQNHGFFAANSKPDEKTVARFESWRKAVGAHVDASEYASLVLALDLKNAKHEALSRTVERDVERTFFAPAERAPLTDFLNVVVNEFNDYHQGLGYIASFLLLVLDAPSVLAMLRVLNADAKYLPGYWKHEAVALATDAHVFNSLLEKRDPEVAAHLAAKYVFADTFCQKWFACLNVHLLRFAQLCDFLDVFFVLGFRASMQFGLVLCDELRGDILEQKTSDKIFELLRLVPQRVSPERQAVIVRRCVESLAAPHPAPFADVDFPALRKHMYDVKLRARMEAAAAANVARATEKDDDDDDADDDDEDEEEGAECGLCAGMPDYYCLECRFAVCGMCHGKTSNPPHAKAHKVENFDYDNATHMSAPTKDEVANDDDADADELADQVAQLNINK